MTIEAFFAYISNRNNINNSNITQSNTATFVNEENRNDLLGSALQQKASDKRLLVKKTTIIPPKSFAKKNSGNKPSCESYINPKYIYIDKNASDLIDGAKFKDSLISETLSIIEGHINTTHISNFCTPNGSIAISSTLDNAISTDGLLQCAGVSFVDKEHNLQTLLHVCPSVSKESNDALIDYILSFSKPENLEIKISPGYYDDTDNTIDYVVNKIKENNEEYNIKFVNFPDSYNHVLVLQNGRLMCTKKEKCHFIDVNPKNKIINA